MVNTQALVDMIQDSGIKISFLADKMGITRQALHMKLQGKRDFKSDEALILANALHINDSDTIVRIFFCPKVQENLNREEE